MLGRQGSPGTRNSKQTLHPVWPLPALNGRAPVILASNAKTPGIDLAYARTHEGELARKYPPGSTNGTASHFMPNSMPAFAVADGVISHACKHVDGYCVLIDHRNGWATYYTNLEHMFALATSERRGARLERVRAGDAIGYVGAPRRGAMKCLHFDLWKLGDDRHYEPVDPRPHITSWLVLPWTDERLTPTDTATAPIAA